MSAEKELRNLTEREYQVMYAFWTSEKPLIASEVAAATALSINTVHAVIKKLLNDGYLNVADIVYSGTVLSRAYQPIVNYEAYTIQEVIKNYQKARNNVSLPHIVATLLEHEENEKETIERLELLLQERKQRLNEDNHKQ